jgi:hypothetical protein
LEAGPSEAISHSDKMGAFLAFLGKRAILTHSTCLKNESYTIAPETNSTRKEFSGAGAITRAESSETTPNRRTVSYNGGLRCFLLA